MADFTLVLKMIFETLCECFSPFSHIGQLLKRLTGIGDGGDEDA